MVGGAVQNDTVSHSLYTAGLLRTMTAMQQHNDRTAQTATLHTTNGVLPTV